MPMATMTWPASASARSSATGCSTGAAIAPGDVLLGLASIGRAFATAFRWSAAWRADKGWKLDRPALFDQDVTLIDALMAPTRIYVKPLLPLLAEQRIRGWRISPAAGCWRMSRACCPRACMPESMPMRGPQPRLMAFLQGQGDIEPEEMARTFNCGIGMVAVVAADQAEGVKQALEAAGETVFAIGTIEAGTRGCTVFGSDEAWSARAAWSATHEA